MEAIKAIELAGIFIALHSCYRSTVWFCHKSIKVRILPSSVRATCQNPIRPNASERTQRNALPRLERKSHFPRENASGQLTSELTFTRSAPERSYFACLALRCGTSCSREDAEAERWPFARAQSPRSASRAARRQSGRPAAAARGFRFLQSRSGEKQQPVYVPK